MGKLLQKLVHGIVPSWLTKIKSSAEASPKKLLLKGSTHASSSSPSSSTRHSTEVPPLVDTDQSIENEEPPCSKACAESSDVKVNPSVAKQGKSASLKPKAHKNNETHHHQDHNDTHHPHHVDVKTHSNQGMHELNTNGCTPPGTPSSRKQSTTSIHKAHNNNETQHHQDHNDTHHPHHVDVKTHSNQGMHERDANGCTPPGTPSSRKQGTTSIHKNEHDHHPQQHQRNNSKNQPEKRNQCVPEADNHHHQDARSGRHNINHMELCALFELEREDNVCVQEDNRHNHREKEHSHEAEMTEDEHYKKLYHDLLGLKRKSQYLQEEEEEELEAEDEGGSQSGSSDTTGWGWKRRKGERGLMSCELPESICNIVGNGKAVVKHSQDPHMVLWESMVEMIVGNGIWELGSLEFLLFCYLSLNEPHLHPLIQSIFLQVLKDLEKA